MTAAHRTLAGLGVALLMAAGLLYAALMDLVAEEGQR